MKKPAVFIDRDGTINEQMGYINHLSRFVLLPGVFEAVRLLNNNGFLAIVITNQSGVARGYFPVDLVFEVHDLMKNLFKEEGAVIDEIYFCPHHPQGIIPEYTCACDCRKPGTDLIDQALESFDIDMFRSYSIGDRYSDMELGYRLGLKNIMVMTGYGAGELKYLSPESGIKPTYIAEDLLSAVHWILEKENAPGNKSA